MGLALMGQMEHLLTCKLASTVKGKGKETQECDFLSVTLKTVL
jgi:hypothetical protein